VEQSTPVYEHSWCYHCNKPWWVGAKFSAKEPYSKILSLKRATYWVDGLPGVSGYEIP